MKSPGTPNIYYTSVSIMCCECVPRIEAHRNTGFSEPGEKVVGDGGSILDMGKFLIDLEWLGLISEVVYFFLERDDGLSNLFHHLL